MFEELLEIAGSSWGLLGLGAVLLITGPGRKCARGAVKQVIKAGMIVSDATREFIAEIKEQGCDLLAEAKTEHTETAEQLLEQPESKITSKSSKKARKARKARKLQPQNI